MTEWSPATGPDHGFEELAPERVAVMHSAVAFAAGFQRWTSRLGTDGLNYPRLRLLEELHYRGPQMMRSLATELALTPRNITDVVDALETEGLVRRMPHPTDRRATLVELTCKGVETAEKELNPRLSAVCDFFSELSEDEQIRLRELLDRLVDGLRRRGQHP